MLRIFTFSNNSKYKFKGEVIKLPHRAIITESSWYDLCDDMLKNPLKNCILVGMYDFEYFQTLRRAIESNRYNKEDSRKLKELIVVYLNVGQKLNENKLFNRTLYRFGLDEIKGEYLPRLLSQLENNFSQRLERIVLNYENIIEIE